MCCRVCLNFDAVFYAVKIAASFLQGTVRTYIIEIWCHWCDVTDVYVFVSNSLRYRTFLPRIIGKIE